MADKTERVHRSRGEMMLNNFLGGVAWSFGIILGTALLFSILTIIGKNIDLVPYVGSFVSDVIDYVMVTNQNIQQ